jgi:serine/threonine protein kinase
MIGSIVSNYRIISLLGEGGMGSVYLAEHVHLESRKVAIKALHKQMLSNTEIRTRFRNEAATLSHINHENIVKIYDYIESEEGFFLIMEFVDGMTLEDFIKNVSGPLVEEKAIRVMSQMLNGFGFAHQRGIIHRDVKPSNIIVSNDLSVVKILDFGVAKLLTEGSNNMTKHGTQMGTVYYMSPEQVKGLQVDQRSDIYSLGVSLYQMVTGTNPYQHLTIEYDVFQEIVNKPLPDARQSYPGVTPKIVSIIEKATQKNIESRYSSCEEMNADLMTEYSSTAIIIPEENISTDTIGVPETQSKKSLWIALASIFVVLLLVLVNFKTIKTYWKWKDAKEMVCYIPSLRMRSDTLTYNDYNILPVSLSYSEKIKVLNNPLLHPWVETEYMGYSGYINSEYLMTPTDFNMLQQLLNSVDKQKQVEISKYRKSLVNHIKEKLGQSYVDTMTIVSDDLVALFDLNQNNQYIKTGSNSSVNRDYAVFLLMINAEPEMYVIVYENGKEIAHHSFTDLDNLDDNQMNSFLNSYYLYYY